jgi:hypothetical protein
MPDDDTRRLPKRPSLVRGMSIISAASLLLLIAGISELADVSRVTLILIRVLAFVAGCALLSAYAYSRYVRPVMSSRPSATLISLPPGQTHKIQTIAGLTKSVTSAQAKLFALVLVAPSRTRQRLSETYEPAQRTLRQTVTVELNLRDAWVREILRRTDGPPTMLIPAIVPHKGALLDNFKIFREDGNAMSTLAYSEYLQLIAGVLRALLTTALGAQKGEDFSIKFPAATQLETEALTAIIQRGFGRQGRVDEHNPSSHAKSVTDKLLALPNIKSSPALQLAASLIIKLSSYYAIVIAEPIPPDGRYLYKYERTVIPELDISGGQSGMIRRLKGHIRVLLGARPVGVKVPLDSASTAQSYHLLIHSEEGLYLGRQEAPGLRDYMICHADNPRPDAVAPPYYRFRKRLGQSYAHFYARFFPEPNSGQRIPAARFIFFEVPPGSLFRATAGAIAAAALVWLVAFVSVNTKIQLNTDAPAILLAFPAIVAGWLGFAKPTPRLLEGTLASRLSLFATAFIALMASGLFMVYQAKVVGVFAWDSPERISILGVRSAAWSILIFASTLNAIGTIFLYAIRTWEFLHLASRDSSSDDAGQT